MKNLTSSAYLLHNTDNLNTIIKNNGAPMMSVAITSNIKSNNEYGEVKIILDNEQINIDELVIATGDFYTPVFDVDDNPGDDVSSTFESMIEEGLVISPRALFLEYVRDIDKLNGLLEEQQKISPREHTLNGYEGPLGDNLLLFNDKLEDFAGYPWVQLEDESSHYILQTTRGSDFYVDKTFIEKLKFYKIDKYLSDSDKNFFTDYFLTVDIDTIIKELCYEERDDFEDLSDSEFNTMMEKSI